MSGPRASARFLSVDEEAAWRLSGEVPCHECDQLVAAVGRGATIRVLGHGLPPTPEEAAADAKHHARMHRVCDGTNSYYLLQNFVTEPPHGHGGQDA